jgi:hypothetical protein
MSRQDSQAKKLNDYLSILLSNSTYTSLLNIINIMYMSIYYFNELSYNSQN